MTEPAKRSSRTWAAFKVLLLGVVVALGVVVSAGAVLSWGELPVTQAHGDVDWRVRWDQSSVSMEYIRVVQGIGSSSGIAERWGPVSFSKGWRASQLDASLSGPRGVPTAVEHGNLSMDLRMATITLLVAVVGVYSVGVCIGQMRRERRLEVS